MLRSFLLRLLFVLSLVLPHAAPAQSLLDAEQAFRLSARALDAGTLEIRYDIAKGYYLYREPFRFELAPTSVKAGAAQLPAGKIHHDEFFGEVETYRGQLLIRLPFSAPEATATLTLKASSQGCADIGVCYPPETRTLRIELPQMSTAPMSSAPVFASPPASSSGDFLADESSQLAELLRDAGFWLVLATFFGAGLLLAFTPCVFPMYPILSGIIAGHGHHISRARALGLSLAYVLGMAFTYAVAGVAAGLSGALLSAALQNVWVLGAVALVFVALALSMFGLFELQLPVFLQSRLSERSGCLRGGSWPGVAALGAVSALIVGPCVAAPLAGALLYIAQTRDAWLGGLALFVLALGKGVPLILVGVSTRSLLPRAGAWMEGVKHFFGIVLLALAIWLVSPLLPDWAHLAAWGALALGCAVFLRALDPLPAASSGWRRLGKGLGLLLLIVGATQIVGAIGGSRSPLQPLEFLRGAAPGVAAPRFERIADLAELQARLAAADRPVMLDFYADWCVSCKQMEKYTFSDPEVAARMARMILLQADVTAYDETDKALLRHFELFGPPGILFFPAGGEERRNLRVIGFQPAKRFLPVVDAALGG